jgi:hypothetical protein
MNRILTIAALAASLAACTGVQLTTAQAVYVSEAGVNGANQAATAAAQSGVLRGSAATTTKRVIDTANTAASAAHAAYLAGNAAVAASQAKVALTNIANAQKAVAP